MVTVRRTERSVVVDTLTEWPLVGRDAVRQRLLAAFAGRSGAPPAVISGPAGAGKTRLMTETLDDVAAAGSQVVRVTGSSATSTIPFGAVAHLIPDELTGADRLAMLRGAFRTLASTVRGDGATVTLAVDDAHLLDPGSAAVVQRAASLTPLRLVLTVRDGEDAPDVIARLVADAATVRIDLEPLTDEQVRSLLRLALAGPVTLATAQRLAHLSEGNPLWLRQLVREARRRKALVQRGGAWRLDGSPVHAVSLPEAMRTTIAGLDPDVRDVVAVVALADVIGVELLEQLFGDDVLAAADVQRLLMAVPDRRRVQVRLAHPLYGEAVLAEVPPLRLRRLRLRLANAVEAAGGRRRQDLLHMARWRLDAGDRSRPELLTAAAVIVGSIQEPATAERFARAALDAGAGFDAMMALAEALQWSGRTAEAVAQLRTAVEAATTPAEWVRAHDLWADVLFWHRCPAEAEEALALAEAAADTSASRHRIAVRRALFALGDGDLAHAVALADGALADPSIDVRVRMDAAFVVLSGAPPCGRSVWAIEVVGGVQRAITEVGGVHPPGCLEGRALACWWAWRFDEVEASVEVAFWADVWSTWCRGLVALTSGRVARARQLLADAARQYEVDVKADVDDQRAQYWSTLSEAAALSGDRTTADEALATAEQLWPPDIVVPYRLTARVWVAAAHDDLTSARRRALEGADAAREVGAHLLEAQLWHDLVRLGDPERAAPRLELLEPFIDGPQGPLYAAHARGLADSDAIAVRRAAGGFEAAGVLLLAAEAYAQLAKLLREQGRSAAAIGAQLASRRLADQCEGARTPALSVAVGLDLTARELEIAQLAAHGLSDREIAERLVISARTVNTHLHRCYTKLGIDGRQDLRDLIG